jgi:hypothetical protein
MSEQNTTVGYVLVSHVHQTVWRSCGKPNCGPNPVSGCRFPERPGCHARCIRDARELAQHPDCQEWQKAFEAWQEAHYHSIQQGGTRLGPLHYFRDCRTLATRGPRRKDARIVALDPGTAEDFGLPTCKECTARMAPLEAQFDNSVAVARARREAAKYDALRPLFDEMLASMIGIRACIGPWNIQENILDIFDAVTARAEAARGKECTEK